MAYYTSNSGQVFATSAQYSSPGVNYPNSAGVHSVPRQLPSHPPGKYAASLNSSSSIGFGVLTIICGAVSFAGAAIGLRFYAMNSELVAGLWCGSMFVAAGAVAIAAGVHKTDSLISGGTATSFLAILFGITQLTISVIGLKEDLNFYNDYSYPNDCRDNSNSYSCRCFYDDAETQETFVIVANSLLVGASVFALIFVLGLLIISCIALCNPKKNQVVPNVDVTYVMVLTSPPPRPGLINGLHANRRASRSDSQRNDRKREVHATLFCFNGQITIASYVPKRNKCVIMLSSLHHDNKFNPQMDKKLEIILDYNMTKGAVDTIDELCCQYTTERGTHRWPLSVFFTLLDITAHNSSIIWLDKYPNWSK